VLEKPMVSLPRSKEREVSVFKIVFWILAGIMAFLIFLSIFQCSFKKPQAPSWNTTVTLPLLNKTYDVKRIIEESNEPSLKIDSLGNLSIDIIENLDTVKVKNILTWQGGSKYFKTNLGSLEINPPIQPRADFILTDIYPGVPGLVPEITLSAQKNVDSLDSYQQATVDTVQAELWVSNQLGLTIDSLWVDLWDNNFNRLVKTLTSYIPIQTGDSVSFPFELINQEISNKFSFRIQAHTPGGTLLTLSDKYLSVGTNFNRIKIKNGLAKIPPTIREENEEIRLENQTVIEGAIIKKGNLSLTIYNGSNLDFEVLVTLPEFTKFSQSLRINQNLTKLTQTQIQIPLDDYLYQPVAVGNIRIETYAQTNGSGTDYIWVNNTDSLSAEANLDSLSFSQISGILYPTVVEAKPSPKELDLPEGFDKASLTNAQLEIKIANTVNFPIECSFLVCGNNGKMMGLYGHIKPGNSTTPTLTLIRQTPSPEFFSPLPTQLQIYGIAVCGNGKSSGSINENDFVFAQVRLSSPWEFLLDSTTVKIKEDSTAINQDIREKIKNNLVWGKLSARFLNHLPLEATGKIYLSKNLETLFSNPDLTIGPINLASGNLDENGLVTEAVASEVNINLNEEQLKLFESSPVYMAGEIHFPGTFGNKIKILSTDFIQISALLETQIKVNQK
jgi:hypothetical protein